jgi:hypothetical protein
MAHIDLAHPEMKAAALVRYEIAHEKGAAKRMLAAAVISATMILVIAALFMSFVR